MFAASLPSITSWLAQSSPSMPRTSGHAQYTGDSPILSLLGVSPTKEGASYSPPALQPLRGPSFASRHSGTMRRALFVDQGSGSFHRAHLLTGLASQPSHTLQQQQHPARSLGSFLLPQSQDWLDGLFSTHPVNEADPGNHDWSVYLTASSPPDNAEPQAWPPTAPQLPHLLPSRLLWDQARPGGKSDSCQAMASRDSHAGAPSQMQLEQSARASMHSHVANAPLSPSNARNQAPELQPYAQSSSSPSKHPTATPLQQPSLQSPGSWPLLTCQMPAAAVGTVCGPMSHLSTESRGADQPTAECPPDAHHEPEASQTAASVAASYLASWADVQSQAPAMQPCLVPDSLHDQLAGSKGLLQATNTAASEYGWAPATMPENAAADMPPLLPTACPQQPVASAPLAHPVAASTAQPGVAVPMHLTTAPSELCVPDQLHLPMPMFQHIPAAACLSCLVSGQTLQHQPPGPGVGVPPTLLPSPTCQWLNTPFWSFGGAHPPPLPPSAMLQAAAQGSSSGQSTNAAPPAPPAAQHLKPGHTPSLQPVQQVAYAAWPSIRLRALQLMQAAATRLQSAVLPPAAAQPDVQPGQSHSQPLTLARQAQSPRPFLLPPTTLPSPTPSLGPLVQGNQQASTWGQAAGRVVSSSAPVSPEAAWQEAGSSLGMPTASVGECLGACRQPRAATDNLHTTDVAPKTQAYKDSRTELSKAWAAVHAAAARQGVPLHVQIPATLFVKSQATGRGALARGSQQCWECGTLVSPVWRRGPLLPSTAAPSPASDPAPAHGTPAASGAGLPGEGSFEAAAPAGAVVDASTTSAVGYQQQRLGAAGVSSGVSQCSGPVMLQRHQMQRRATVNRLHAAGEPALGCTSPVVSIGGQLPGPAPPSSAQWATSTHAKDSKQQCGQLRQGGLVSQLPVKQVPTLGPATPVFANLCNTCGLRYQKRCRAQKHSPQPTPSPSSASACSPANSCTSFSTSPLPGDSAGVQAAPCFAGSSSGTFAVGQTRHAVHPSGTADPSPKRAKLVTGQATEVDAGASQDSCSDLTHRMAAVRRHTRASKMGALKAGRERHLLRKQMPLAASAPGPGKGGAAGATHATQDQWPLSDRTNAA